MRYTHTLGVPLYKKIAPFEVKGIQLLLEFIRFWKNLIANMLVLPIPLMFPHHCTSYPMLPSTIFPQSRASERSLQMLVRKLYSSGSFQSLTSL